MPFLGAEESYEAQVDVLCGFFVKSFSCILKVACRIESLVMVLSLRKAFQCHQSQMEHGFSPFPVQGGLGNHSDAS